MKTSNKILSLILFAVVAVSLMMSACAAEGLLISPNPLSVTDCKVYTAEEHMPFIGTTKGFKAELKELDGKNVIHITSDGIKAATSEYVIFNFYPQDKPEDDFVPEFKIKDYPYVVVAYKSDIITTNSSLAINAGMRALEYEAYERFWGLTAPLKHDNKPHKA